MSARSPAHSITETSKPGIRTSCFGYDLDGLLTQAGALAGGAAQKNAYAYDDHGALDALISTRDADTLFATSYTRDSLSRITTLTERVAGVTQTIGFTYDSVGRLSAVARNGITTASYTYDLNGNRATKTTSGGVATAVVDDQDRLTSYGGATYAYTNNGELSRKVVGTDTTLYTYDALGNLTHVRLSDGTAIGYLIDAQNRRIGKTVNDTLVRAWLYQGQLTPVAELDGQGNVVSRFVYATGVNVPDYLVRGDSTYRLIRDHLGSVRLVVNVASGTVAQRLSYDEFGIETENTNPAWQPFGYAGGLTDAQTGLVRFGARDYDPASGRWTAKDPIGFAGGATSLYAYVANDPVNAVDRAGLVVEVLVVDGFPGHTAIRINGTVYSNGRYGEVRGPLGILGENIIRTSTLGAFLAPYKRRGNAVMGYTLRLTAEQEAGLAAFYAGQLAESTGGSSGMVLAGGDYNLFTNNCTTLVVNALQSILPWHQDLAISTFVPSDLGTILKSSPWLVSAMTQHVASRP